MGCGDARNFKLDMWYPCIMHNVLRAIESEKENIERERERKRQRERERVCMSIEKFGGGVRGKL